MVYPGRRPPVRYLDRPACLDQFETLPVKTLRGRIVPGGWHCWQWQVTHRPERLRKENYYGISRIYKAESPFDIRDRYSSARFTAWNWLCFAQT